MKLAAPTVAELNYISLQVYKDIFNKEFEDNIPKMSDWLALIRFKLGIASPESVIDWLNLSRRENVAGPRNAEHLSREPIFGR